MEADAREVPVRILGAGRRRGPRGRPRVEGRAAGGVLFDDWHDPDAMYEHAAATITEEELEEAVIVSANPQEHVERIALLNVSGADPHRDRHVPRSRAPAPSPVTRSGCCTFNRQLWRSPSRIAASAASTPHAAATCAGTSGSSASCSPRSGR